jgi:RNA polymerase sigma factor (sigma-70 family)
MENLESNVTDYMITPRGEALSRQGARYTSLGSGDFSRDITYGEDGRVLEDNRSDAQKVIANEIVESIDRFLKGIVDGLRSYRGAKISKTKTIRTIGRTSLNFEEMCNEGVLVVLKILNGYASEKGSMTTYLTNNIAGRVHKESLRNGNGVIKIPVHIHDTLKEIYKLGNHKGIFENVFEAYYRSKKPGIALMIAGSVDEWAGNGKPISKFLEDSLTQLEEEQERESEELTFDEEMQRCSERNVLTYEDNFKRSEDTPSFEEGYSNGVLDIADKNATSTLEKLIEKDQPEDQRMLVDTLLNNIHLTDRERKVLEMRFGLNGNKEHTLQVIGGYMGISRERARQIEAVAIKKLKRSLTQDIGNYVE